MVQRGQEASTLLLVPDAVEQNDRAVADDRLYRVGHGWRERRHRNLQKLADVGGFRREQHIAETRDGHRECPAALGSSPKVSLGVVPRADLVHEPESWTRRCAQRGGHDASDIAAIVASTACVDCRFPTVIRAPPSE